MLNSDSCTQTSQNRAETVAHVQRVMARFPMIVDILNKLNDSPIPLSGDEDIRHGCQRALTAMLVDLSRIEPAPPGDPSSDEKEIMSWLENAPSCRLIDADQLERFQNFIDRILNPEAIRA